MSAAESVGLAASEPPFTGVRDEPASPRARSPLVRLSKWMRSLFSFTSTAKAPSSFNWDDRGVVPVPGDQGALAACISYAACFAASTSYQLKTGKALAAAPRVMHLCTMGFDPDMGTNSYDLEDAAVAHGLPFTTSASAGGQASTMTAKAQCGLFSATPRLKVTSVKRFETADEVKAELSSSGPVVVHMKLYDDFWRSYVPGSIYRSPPGATTTKAHAVCLIGYDDGRQCWIGVNSRGPGWGSNGRFLLQYGQCDVMTSGAPAYALSIAP
jgi:C1A family cysteine protease